MQSEYWLHRPTGFVWAVTLENDAVQSAAGPLEVCHADPELLAFLDYSHADGCWITAHRCEFRRVGVTLS
jgi:hypothetical protein